MDGAVLTSFPVFFEQVRSTLGTYLIRPRLMRFCGSFLCCSMTTGEGRFVDSHLPRPRVCGHSFPRAIRN